MTPTKDLTDKVNEVQIALARQEMLLQTINERLFGKEGVPGALNYIDAKVDTKAEASDVKELEAKQDDLESKMHWFSGVGATILFIITTFMTYIGIHIPPAGH